MAAAMGRLARTPGAATPRKSRRTRTDSELSPFPKSQLLTQCPTIFGMIEKSNAGDLEVRLEPGQFRPGSDHRLSRKIVGDGQVGVKIKQQQVLHRPGHQFPMQRGACLRSCSHVDVNDRGHWLERSCPA